MGDTGSMLIGFMVGLMSVRFLALDTESLSRLPFNAVDIPIVIISFIIIPLFDTARVFTIRLLNGRSPFSADRNHVHHILIDAFKISHRKASFLIASVNICCVLTFSLLLKLTNTYFATTVILMFSGLAVFFLYKIKPVVIKGRIISRATIKKKHRKLKKNKKDNEIRGGFMEGKPLTAREVDELAKLPSLDELRGKLLGCIASPANGLVAALSSPQRGLVNVLDQYAKQKQQSA